MIETGRSLLLFKQTLKQLEVTLTPFSHSQEILHFNSSRFFTKEYERIIQFFLYEDIKLLTKDKSSDNPFQHPTYFISKDSSVYLKTLIL